MPAVINVGGPITGALAIALVAWAIRALRSTRRTSAPVVEPQPAPAPTTPPKYLGYLTPAAVRMLVETCPLQHTVFEVSHDGNEQILPGDLSAKGIKVSEASLSECLQDEATWAAQAGRAVSSLPDPQNLVLVVSAEQQLASQAAARVAAAGYQRCCLCVATRVAFEARAVQGASPTFISRDAVWLALQVGSAPFFVLGCVAIDVRRPDERLCFGAPRGTINIPAELLPWALQLESEEFLQKYGAPKPALDTPVIILSRAGRRAAWAAQVALDAALKRVYLYKQGTNGWKLEQHVKPYRSYHLGDAPPEAEMFHVEQPDEGTGLEELHRLGLPLVEGRKHGRFTAFTLHDLDEACLTAAAVAARTALPVSEAVA